MRVGFAAVAIGILIVVVLIYSSIFIINPTQQALVLQFGEVRRAIQDPGPNVKIPLIQDVVFLDKRILDLNVPEQEIIASDQKRLVVDAFARYRIANPVLFFQSVNNVREGASRLSTFLQSALRAVLADASFEQIVRDDRPGLMQRIIEAVSARASDIGIELVDVRLRRADLPAANSQAIYRRMQTERQREATEIRAQGAEAARRIRALADRNGIVIQANAQQEAEQIRGDGDARRSTIFAAAYGRDPQFFKFYRSMRAYETGLTPGQTRLVISPNSDFFRFFNDPSGGLPAVPGAASGAADQPGPADGALPDDGVAAESMLDGALPSGGLPEAAEEAEPVTPDDLTLLQPGAGRAAGSDDDDDGGADLARPGPDAANENSGREGAISENAAAR